MRRGQLFVNYSWNVLSVLYFDLIEAGDMVLESSSSTTRSAIFSTVSSRFPRHVGFMCIQYLRTLLS